jgi:hypothetical protein
MNNWSKTICWLLEGSLYNPLDLSLFASMITLNGRLVLIIQQSCDSKITTHIFSMIILTNIELINVENIEYIIRLNLVY